MACGSRARAGSAWQRAGRARSAAPRRWSSSWKSAASGQRLLKSALERAGSTSRRGQAPVIRNGRSGLEGSPLARTSAIMPRATRTRTPSAISSSSSLSSDHLRDLADQAAGGDDLVAAPHVLDHLLMVLRPLLLGPDDQETHDDEDQDERDELHEHVRRHRRRRPRLGKSRGDHLRLSKRVERHPSKPSRQGAPEKVARTIASGSAESNGVRSRSACAPGHLSDCMPRR